MLDTTLFKSKQYIFLASGAGGLVAKSCPTLVTHWAVAHQAPLSMGFLRQEYWSVLPFPIPGDIPDPGSEPSPVESPALAGRFFTKWHHLGSPK